MATARNATSQNNNPNVAACSFALSTGGIDLLK